MDLSVSPFAYALCVTMRYMPYGVLVSMELHLYSSLYFTITSIRIQVQDICHFSSFLFPEIFRQLPGAPSWDIPWAAWISTRIQVSGSRAPRPCDARCARLISAILPLTRGQCPIPKCRAYTSPQAGLPDVSGPVGAFQSTCIIHAVRTRVFSTPPAVGRFARRPCLWEPHLLLRLSAVGPLRHSSASARHGNWRRHRRRRHEHQSRLHRSHAARRGGQRGRHGGRLLVQVEPAVAAVCDDDDVAIWGDGDTAWGVELRDAGAVAAKMTHVLACRGEHLWRTRVIGRE